MSYIIYFQLSYDPSPSPRYYAHYYPIIKETLQELKSGLIQDVKISIEGSVEAKSNFEGTFIALNDILSAIQLPIIIEEDCTISMAYTGYRKL